jgi:hypothetical protein
MPRPFTDIAKAINSNPIKNGSYVGGTTFTGKSNIYNQYVNNNPDIDTIKEKYGNRFYNGILVNIITGDINGGTSIN